MSARLKVAIADDESLARRRIARLLSKDNCVDVVAMCENATDLIRQLSLHPVDAVFLDIDMPDGDGFSAISQLPPPLPRIVFVTAYSAFASQAFDIDATDYLVKPVSLDRLTIAVERIRRDLASVATPPRVESATYPKHIAFAIGRERRRVDVDSIDHVIAQSNYLEARTGCGSLVLRRPISWLMAQLDPQRFVRIHRSHIVRISAVAKIDAMPYGCYRFSLESGERIVSGRSYRDHIRSALALTGPAG
jgi:two-component system LytT family response regulator